MLAYTLTPPLGGLLQIPPDTSAARQIAALAAAVQALADSLATLRSTPIQSTQWHLSDFLGLLGGMVALGTFTVGLWQYARAQNVERAKFAITLVEQFEKDPVIRNATWMLDWDGREIPLWPDDRATPPRLVNVDRAMVEKALRLLPATFTDEEAAIRDTFDRLFYQLGRFEQLSRSHLVSVYNLRPYLIYWCEILAGRKHPVGSSFIKALDSYMMTYGFDDARRFIHRVSDV